MREIKFRVWDNEEKNFWGEGRNLSLVSLVSDSVVNDDSTVLEQYTGLKDFNGVDIYEGDIVKIPLNEAAYSNNTIAVISYNENSTLLAGRLVLSRIYTAVEVIGNIHENVDLLVDDIGNGIHEFLHGGDK